MLYENSIINVTPLDSLDLPYELISDKNILRFNQFFEKNYKGHSFDLNYNDLLGNKKSHNDLSKNVDEMLTKEDLIKKNPNITDHINSYLEKKTIIF